MLAAMSARDIQPEKIQTHVFMSLNQQRSHLFKCKQRLTRNSYSSISDRETHDSLPEWRSPHCRAAQTFPFRLSAAAAVAASNAQSGL